ncbi:MAG TPA: HIT family protein [Myxococcaceae bacterium]|nr:HIT family protein [Myxococcaceae bacterium]
MADLNNPCLACSIVAGGVRPQGGVIARHEGLVLHGFADPSPIPGWVVLTTERHARALYELDHAEATALGPFAARVMRAQREVLGAEHVYAFAIGDALLHFHLHLVPRYADTPERLRGRKAFDVLPGDARPPREIEDAAAALARELGRR